MLYDNLKSDLNAYRKVKDSFAVRILSTLIGEVDRVDPKGAGDEVVISVLNKVLSGLRESPLRRDESQEYRDLEMEIISYYVPKQMDEETLAIILEDRDFQTVGEWMKFLKENYSGRYDGKVASLLFKERQNKKFG